MLKINPTKDAKKFTDGLPSKQQKQIARKLLELCLDPFPVNSIKMMGRQNDPLHWRVKAGEFRIIYYVEKDELRVLLIDKRNDAAIYKVWERKYKD